MRGWEVSLLYLFVKMYHLMMPRLRIFLFRRKVMFHSQDIQVFLALAVPWFTKSVTSWSVLGHETNCIFEYIFWPTIHQITKLGQLVDINICIKFSGIFWTICRTGASFQVFFNLATCSNYSITNYVNIPVFHFILFLRKGEQGTIKNGKCQQLKMARSCYTVSLTKS